MHCQLFVTKAKSARKCLNRIGPTKSSLAKRPDPLYDHLFFLWQIETLQASAWTELPLGPHQAIIGINAIAVAMQSRDKGQQIALQSRDKDATNAQVALACANLVPGYGSSYLQLHKRFVLFCWWPLPCIRCYPKLPAYRSFDIMMSANPGLVILCNALYVEPHYWNQKSG